MMIKTFSLALCLLISVTACEENDAPEMAITESLPTEDAPVIDRSAETFLLANIFKDGHEFRFITDGDQVDMLEKLPDNKENAIGFLEENLESTPFDIFVALTEATVAVPAIIAKTAEAHALAQSNRQVDYTNQPVTMKYNSSSTEKSLGCSDLGQDAFYDTHCFPPVVSTSSSMEFCDNGSWLTLIRSSVFGNSWKKVKKVSTRTNVICGLTRIQFQYWNGSGWTLYHQVDFTNGIWIWNQNRSSAEYRRVVRNRPNNSGSFRAYTRFYN